MRSDPLGDLGVLENCQIHGAVPRSVELVSGQVTECAGRRLCKSCGIQPSNTRAVETMRDTGVRVGNEVGSLVPLVRTGVVVRRGDVEWLASTESSQTA